MQTCEHTWSLLKGSLEAPEGTLLSKQKLEEGLSVFLWGSWWDVRNSSFLPPGWPFVSECSPGWVAEEHLQGTCSRQVKPWSALGFGSLQLFLMCMSLQLTHKTAHICPSLPHLLCGQSFFMVLLYKPPDIFFLFFIASHDPWQTQLPQHGGDGCHQCGPWKNPVLLTDTFVVPRWDICSPKMSPRDTVATYAPQKKYSEAFIVCCTCD